jgi:pyruvate/2-oxoglutarate/acetoin dehydrogenase E1 component
MSGGQLHVPLVVRMATGAGRQLAAQHSHSLEGFYAHVPGLRVVAPGTVEDARGMLWTAIHEPDPVIVFEHVQLYGVEAEIGAVGSTDLDHAVVRRPGRDVTLLAWGGCLPKIVAAAERLAAEGIEAEVVDVRVLRPLDVPTLAASVRRTRRAVVVDEAWRTGGFAAEIAACLTEEAFWDLDAPIARVASAEVPIPYPKHLEDAALPSVEAIVAAARRTVRGTDG